MLHCVAASHLQTEPHVYECKAKEELSSKSNLNFENFLIQKKFW